MKELEELVGDIGDPDLNRIRRRVSLKERGAIGVAAVLRKGAATREAIYAAYVAHGADQGAIRILAAERGCTREYIRSQLRQYRNGNVPRRRAPECTK